MNLKTNVVFKRASDEWETPPEVIADLRKEFGHFNLDPCSDKKKAKAGYYFNKRQDGLSRKWFGKVYMNPPFSDVKNWVAKAWAESKSTTRKVTVVALLPARTDTKWFHQFIYHQAEIRFIKGRLHFSGHKWNAPFPNMIVIWRPKVFAEPERVEQG